MVTGGPPERSTFGRGPPAENAIWRPSGDQKGNSGLRPGVAISVALSAFRGRTKSFTWFALIPAVNAVNAMRWPSGDITRPSPYEVFILSGTETWKRTIAGGAASLRKCTAIQIGRASCRERV